MSEKYPLDQLVTIKQRRLEEAEKVLIEKKKILEQEQQKLSELEQKRDETQVHYKAKLSQLRESLDSGAPPAKITQMKQYLKLVVEDLKAAQLKVDAQLKIVASAQSQVNLAREDLFKKQKDIEKLKIHHKEWKKEMLGIEEQKEGHENDEVGNTRHSLRKAKRKKDG